MPASVTDEFSQQLRAAIARSSSRSSHASSYVHMNDDACDALDELEMALQSSPPRVHPDNSHEHTTMSSETAATAYFLAGDARQLLHLDGPPVTTCNNGHDHTAFDAAASLQRQVSSSHIETRSRAALHHVSESFRDSLLDLYAASKIFAMHLITFESLFVVLSSLLATTGYYVYSEHRVGKSFGANISWMIVSFAIVAPMIMQIKQAFARRELALDVLAECTYVCLL